MQKFYELLKQDPAVVNDLQKAVEVADNTEKAACCLIEFAGSQDLSAISKCQFDTSGMVLPNLLILNYFSGLA